MTPTVTYARRRLARASMPAVLTQLEAGAFEGYASLFGVPDGAGDVMAPGAFKASLRKHPASQVRMLYQHFAHEPIGVWDSIVEDPRGLLVRGHLVLDVQRARDVRSLIADGALNGLSIGFRTLRARRDARTGLRTLLDVELWEISIVTFPLLAGSGVTAIGAKGALAHDLRQAAAILRPENRAVIPAGLAKRARAGTHRDTVPVGPGQPLSRLPG